MRRLGAGRRTRRTAVANPGGSRSRLVRGRDLLRQHRIIGTDADCQNFGRGLRPADPRHGGGPRLGGQVHPHRQHLATLRLGQLSPAADTRGPVRLLAAADEAAVGGAGASWLAGWNPMSNSNPLPPSGYGDPSPAGALRGLPADSRTPTGASQHRADRALRESPPGPGRQQLTPPRHHPHSSHTCRCAAAASGPAR